MLQGRKIPCGKVIISNVCLLYLWFNWLKTGFPQTNKLEFELAENRMDFAQFWQNAFALAIGTAGFACALGLGFPAPSLTGPALFVSAASIAGARIDVHPWLRNLAFLLIGIAMGSGVTPQIFDAARHWPVSFGLLAFTLVVLFFLCRTILEIWWKLDRHTATLSSVPGHMSYVLGLSLQSRGDVATVSVIQSIRVLLLTLVVPVVVAILGYEAPEVQKQTLEMNFQVLAGIGAGAVVCAGIFTWFNLPASFLLAGILVSALVHVTGWGHGALPEFLWLPCIIVLGTIIGTRLSGVSRAVLKKAVFGGLITATIAMICSTIAALGLSYFGDLPFSQLLIAFAPGGVEAMSAMAIILDADPTFVAAHHLWRLLVLTFLAPVMLAMAKGK